MDIHFEFEEEQHSIQPIFSKTPDPSSLTLEVCDIESPNDAPMLSCITGCTSLHLNTLCLVRFNLPEDGVLDILCRAPDVQILDFYKVKCGVEMSLRQWESIVGDWNLDYSTPF